jgi:ATP-dependent Clp protease ATP-binding subunit ClpC
MARKPEAQNTFQEGLRLLRTGDPEGAALSFRSALDMAPDDYEISLHLGHALAATRAWTRTADAYRLAVRLAPDQARPAVALGDALIECGCAQEALEAFEAAARLEPSNPNAWMGVGRALRTMGDPERAITAYRKTMALRPEDLRPVRGLASCLESLHRYADVIALWSAVLERQPDSPIAQRARDAAQRALSEHPNPLPAPTIPARRDDAERKHAWALALVRDSRLDEALAALDEAVNQRPRLTEAHRERGRILAALQRWDEAVSAFEAAVRLDPHDAAAVGLAQALSELGREHEALRAYDQALVNAPDDVRAHTARADLLRRMQRLPEALAGFEAALTRDPHDLDALVGRANVLATMNRHADALPIWRRVLRIAPDHPVALRGLKRSERELEESGEDAGERKIRGVARIHFDLGKTLLQQSRFAEAIAAFKRAAETRKDWAEPWFYSGIASMRASDHRRALRSFDRALERDPTHVEAACHKADLHRLENEYAEAVATYEIALGQAPELVHAIGGRAEALRLLGRPAEALEGFTRALQLDPRDFVSLCGMAATLTNEQRYDEARPLWEKARGIRPRASFVQRGLAQCEAAASGAVIRDDVLAEPVPAPPAATQDDRQAKARQAACDELDRGRSFHKERNFPAAVNAFRRALDHDPTFSEAALRLGMAFEDDRQFRKAVTAYETCLEIEPNHFQAATNIGEAHRKNEHYLEAIQAYDRALAIRPDYLYALAGRAECLRMIGRYEESLDWFDRALKVGSNHAFAIQGKAAALNALHRYKDAMSWWTRALEIEPTSAFAQDGKAYCEAQLRRAGDDTTDTTEDEAGTPTLDEQGRDLTALARAGQLPPVIGRDKEIRAVMKTLVRRLKANPLLLGEPGVGKTAVVEGVAQRLIERTAPDRLKQLRIVELSMGNLVAGTKYRGTFEERLREIVKEAKRSPGLVLFIDEIHTLVGAGRTEGGSLDAANILKPALARGEITVIGATTQAEYRRHLESDSALERRFQPITIGEPTERESIELLSRIRRQYEEHHAVRILPSAIDAAVRMAVRYVPDRRLPDKALDLIDEACSEASLSGQTTVDEATVALVISERTGVPVSQLTEAERGRLAAMENTLDERVLGQQAAVRKLSAAVRMAKAGLRDLGRPRGVFLFRGGPGVGKTELAKALAEFLFPEGNALIRLDMSEFSDRFTTTRLLGAPPGYSGHGEEGVLTGPLRRKPYSVVLLDEVDKSHPDVQALFLTLLDEGFITDSEGRHVNAREAFFVLTTTSGVEGRRGGRLGFGQVADRERALEQLKAVLRPELVNRLDEIIELEPLSQPALEKIVSRRLKELAERALTTGIRLSWSDEVVQRIAARSRDSQDGARPALRAVETLVGEPVGRAMLVGGGRGPRTWRAALRDGEVVVEPEGESSRAQQVQTTA